MGYLFENLWLCMLVAALIGLLTGWWIWSRREYAEDEVTYVEEPVAEEQATPPVTTTVPDNADTAATKVGSDIAGVTGAEPETTTTEQEAAPAVPPTEASSPFMAAPDGEPDDLTRIKGIGPKLNALLNSLGVYHFRQIAGWDTTQVAEVDSHLENFKGRIERDRWVDQAGYLANDDIDGFEREFGNIDRQS